MNIQKIVRTFVERSLFLQLQGGIQDDDDDDDDDEGDEDDDDNEDDKDLDENHEGSFLATTFPGSRSLARNIPSII